NAGAGIQNNDLPIGAKFDATGVSAVAERAPSRNRDRAANAPESYAWRHRFTFRRGFWPRTARHLRQKTVYSAGEQFPRDRFKQIFISAGFQGAGSIDSVISPRDDDDFGRL